MMPRLEQAGREPGGRLGRRRWLAACTAAVGGWLTPGRSWGATTDQADTSARAREEAIGSLPLSKLTAESRRKLMAVCENPSLFRRLPQKTVDCDPELHRFLVRNPEVVVNIWQLMGFSNYTAERTGPYIWKGDDGTGTTGDVELVYGTDDLHVMYGDGFYEGSLLRKKITGRCVLILHSGYGQDAARRWLVGNRLDLFLQLDNVGADIMARTLAPWVGKVADTNFAESCKFAAKVSQTAEQNGPGMQRLADKLTAVQPEVRDEFARVSSAVHQRAAGRDTPERMR
jgi:hypothetical protein